MLGLGSSHFARHYFGNHCCFLFLRVLRCFSSPRWPLLPMYSAINIPTLLGMGFPIRISPGQSLFSGSPKLIAASHVLHRHPAPRHPPLALSSLAIIIYHLFHPRRWLNVSLFFYQRTNQNQRFWLLFINFAFKIHWWRWTESNWWPSRSTERDALLFCLACSLSPLFFYMVEVNGIEPVSPFGYLRVKACLAARRSLSQLATSFIATQRQGIHRLPLVAWP
jgi:hypothetical protein